MEFTKHEYSVLETCSKLHYHCKGWGDGLSNEDFDRVLAWLTWRISPDVWSSSKKDDFTFVDSAIWGFANAIVFECKQWAEFYRDW
jgi:hypothetical protein